MSILNWHVNSASIFVSFFIVMTHNSSVNFKFIFFILHKKGPMEVPILTLSSALVKICQIPHRDRIKRFGIVNYESFFICSRVIRNPYVPKKNYKVFDFNYSTRKVITKTWFTKVAVSLLIELVFFIELALRHHFIQKQK